MSEVIHIPELRLRRFRASELPPAARSEVQGHLAECGSCRARLQGLDAEQRSFEAEVPFERFVGGVNRATRTATSRGARPPWVRPALAMAAVLVAILAVGPRLASKSIDRGRNRTKGGASVELRVSSAGEKGPQRVAVPEVPEALARGERVRIGFVAEKHRYVAAISVDEQGQVTRLYPESGASLAITPGSTPQYLPGSLEFTGAGLENVVVVLSDTPLTVESLGSAASAAYARSRGDLRRLPALEVPGDQFQQLLLKP